MRVVPSIPVSIGHSSHLRRRAAACGAVAAAALVCSAAAARQPAPQPSHNPGLPPTFTRVEPGTQDIRGRTDGRLFQRFDQGAPTNFEAVYRIDRANALGGATKMFARVSGGLTAVFPRSTYANTAAGMVPVTPPGTIFYIGELPPEVSGVRPAFGWSSLGPRRGSAEPEGTATRVDLSAAAVFDAGPSADDQWAAEAIESIWMNEPYRRDRIGRWLERATGAGPAAGR